MTRYESAKEIFAKYGVDTDAAIEKCKSVPVSLHCWQGDDVIGFDHDGPLTGGIQTTGNYPGKAKTPDELFADMDKALSLMPGAKKINVHACYAIFEDGEFVDRDKIEPKHFQRWVDFAKERGMGLDFNPTFFSHDKVKDGLTLSSPDEETRKFWIEHGKACIRISTYFAEQTGIPCVMNIWTGDGYKDVPADRMGPRVRYKESIDAILSEPYDPKWVKPCVESKVFGLHGGFRRVHVKLRGRQQGEVPAADGQWPLSSDRGRFRQDSGTFDVLPGGRPACDEGHPLGQRPRASFG